MDMKTCRLCGKTKNLIDFVKHKQSKGGYLHACKVCTKEQRQTYYSKNKTHILNRNNEYRVTNGMWYNKSIEHRLRYVIQMGTKRAQKKSIEWNLTLEFLLQMWEKQQYKCAYSGVPLTYEDNHSHTISLDRIDSSKGYTEDNVQYVCTIVNYIKQRFDESHFFTFCKQVAQNCK